VAAQRRHEGPAGGDGLDEVVNRVSPAQAPGRANADACDRDRRAGLPEQLRQLSVGDPQAKGRPQREDEDVDGIGHRRRDSASR
jgi:hypothetical protein